MRGTICQNGLRIDQDLIDKALIRAIGEALDERMQPIEWELSLIETYEKNLADAIAKCQDMDSLVAKLPAEEGPRRRT